MTLFITRLLYWPGCYMLWRSISQLFTSIFNQSDPNGQAGSAAGLLEGIKEESAGLEPLKPSTDHSIEERIVMIEQTDERRLLRIGIYAEVYLLNGTVVRKEPRSASKEHILPILYEATIYSRLGNHPRLAECLSLGVMEHVDVKYYPHGDLATYLEHNSVNITHELQSKWFEQIIEAIIEIHEHEIIHSDLALRQFFLDNDLNVRLGDFNASQFPGQPALGYEKATHCLPRDYELPNTIKSDLFALGSNNPFIPS